jgi:large subunit ribosomal protein L25
MATETPTLTGEPRTPAGSRDNGRLRRTGRVPGVLYGGGDAPVHFSVDARELRIALQHSTAVIELTVEGASTPAQLKDVQRDPVRGDAWHVDFLRVRMDRPIQTPVTVELTGAEDAPGTSAGGVLEQQTRELNVEALPGDVPESIRFDASHLEAGATLTLADLTAPRGVTFLDDPETVVASITLPRLEVETPDALETETEVVGAGEGEAFAPEGSDVATQPETPGAGSGDPGATETTAQ